MEAGCKVKTEVVDMVAPVDVGVAPISAKVRLEPPLGVAQVPSPRQKVAEEADVPEFRLVTGRLPVTPVVRGNPVALVNRPDRGVPSVGLVIIGLVRVLLTKT